MHRIDVVTGAIEMEEREFTERPQFIGGLIGNIISTGISQAATQAFAPGGIFGGGGFFPTSPSLPAPPAPATSIASYTPTSAGSALRTAIPWATRMLKRYGPIIGQMIIDLYQQAKIDGLSENAARSRALSGAGVRGSGRRMNPTNVKALRRAIRRVRSFKRVTRKVNRLLPSPGRARARVVYRRRRGDVNPFVAEDLADVYDEMEDLGYEPDSFRSDEENGD